MPGIHDFPAFLTAGILLNLTPGNDTISIVSRSLAQGRRAGILSALGIGTGSVGHTLLAAFGLSRLIRRCCGAALVALGIRLAFTARS